MFILWPALPVGSRLYLQKCFMHLYILRTEVHHCFSMSLCLCPGLSIQSSLTQSCLAIQAHILSSDWKQNPGSYSFFRLEAKFPTPAFSATCLVSVAALGEGLVLHELALPAVAGRDISVLLKKKRSGSKILKFCSEAALTVLNAYLCFLVR